MSKVLHQTGQFQVVLNEGDKELFNGPHGITYYDNYHVVHLNHGTIEARSEDYLTALRLCETFEDHIKNRLYIPQPNPFAGIMGAEGLGMFDFSGEDEDDSQLN